MTARDWAFLGCRMMALAHAVVAFMSVPVTFLYMSTPLPGGEASRDLSMRLMNILPLMLIATKLITAAILFYGAGFFSSILVRAPEAKAKPLPPKSVVAIGVFLVAVFEAFEFGPGLLQGLQQSFSQDSVSRDISTLVVNVIGLAFVAGLFLWTWVSLRSNRDYGDTSAQER